MWPRCPEVEDERKSLHRPDEGDGLAEWPMASGTGKAYRGPHEPQYFGGRPGRRLGVNRMHAPRPLLQLRSNGGLQGRGGSGSAKGSGVGEYQDRRAGDPGGGKTRIFPKSIQKKGGG